MRLVVKVCSLRTPSSPFPRAFPPLFFLLCLVVAILCASQRCTSCDMSGYLQVSRICIVVPITPPSTSDPHQQRHTLHFKRITVHSQPSTTPLRLFTRLLWGGRSLTQEPRACSSAQLHFSTQLCGSSLKSQSLKEGGFMIGLTHDPRQQSTTRNRNCIAITCLDCLCCLHLLSYFLLSYFLCFFKAAVAYSIPN